MDNDETTVAENDQGTVENEAQEVKNETPLQEEATTTESQVEGNNTAETTETEAEPTADKVEEVTAESEIEKLTAALKQEQEKNVRLYADFENFRRRTTRERSETFLRATQDAITEFLPVMDNFERALGAAKEGDAFADGVRIVYDQLKGVFKKVGVEKMVSMGEDFNPDLHEAIAYQPSPDLPEGKVMYEVKCGYKMHDKVIRVATVIVSSGAQAEEPSK